jgi:two-component system sensor histidine kinase ChiS
MIVLFLGDRQHREYLLFALLSISGSLFAVFAELMQLFPIDPRYYEFLDRVAPTSLIAIPLFLFLFLSEQFEYRNRWLTRTFVGLSLAVIALSFIPIDVRKSSLLFQIRTVWMQLQFLICVILIGWAVWRKKPASRLFVFGVLTATLGALFSFRVDESIWGFGGFAVFMFVMAFSLSRKMAANQREVRNTRDIFRLFVPEPVLDRIAKQGLHSIRLGGAEESAATIVFTDIKAFASIAEKLSPNQTLQFLNSFMRTMQPLIHDNGGFINQFVGDEIMAIFHQPGHVDAGLETAIAMRRALEPYNTERKGRNESSIDIGIGINTGGIIWGTIGSEARMESAVIGDAVNLASRLQSLTRHYGVLILASEHVVQQLSHPETFGYREVDIVQVKGRNQTVAVYEFFDADPEPVKSQKKQLLGHFMEGIVRFRANYWGEAQALFSECLRICPVDQVSHMYVDRCKSLQLSPPETEWNGITVHLKK